VFCTRLWKAITLFDPAVIRILDANLNRAREAMRVMEEYARFVLNDGGLSQGIKDLRHRLAAACAQSYLANVVALRDSAGDVGAMQVGAGEYSRTSAGDVVVVAGKRLSEALRVLEEYGKTIDAGWAAQIERLRYLGYDLEKRLCCIVQARTRFGGVRLYVLVTADLCRGDWREVVKAAIEGGADCVQLREKELTDAQFVDRSGEFCTLCRAGGALSVINDRADVAVACVADGVHLGQEDMDAGAARRVVGADRLVGVSTHSVEQAQAAALLCPDYIAVGPMFATELKPEYGVAGPQALSAVREATSVPLVAIGGIDAANVKAIVDAGVRCVAVCRAVIGAEDVTAAARRIRAALD
jgi:thiamine-phosphate pyrophosphorylase